MELFTKEIDDKLFSQYQLGSELETQEVVARIYNPVGAGVWYLLNSDPEDPDYLWVIATIHETEMGSASRSELEDITIGGCFKLERDLNFIPINASELFNKLIEQEKKEKRIWL